MTEGAYISHVHQAFLCRSCRPGWRRFWGPKTVRRRQGACGPVQAEVELCNKAIYNNFGGDAGHGKLRVEVAADLLAQGRYCTWLYGLCNSHWDEEGYLEEGLGGPEVDEDNAGRLS